MKFATHAGVAVVIADGLAYPLPGGITLTEAIALGLDRALSLGDEALKAEPTPYDETLLDLPFRPASVRDFVTFESHVEGVRRSIEGTIGVPEAWYDAPTFYFTNPHALYGPGAAIPRPRTCRALDFEMEVGVVVGRTGSDLTEQQAEDAIFGYTIVNDWSARDLQGREMQVGLGPAKGKDFATSIGPWIVTPDELPSLDLACTAYVNDTLVGQDKLSSMHWSFAEMIAYASRDSVVLATDLLASGTTGGGGCLAELWGRAGERTPPPLEPGDEVRLEVDGLGVLTASVR